MIRSIEIPTPVFEADVSARWNPEDDTDTYTCQVLVDSKFVVFERVVTGPPHALNEDHVKDEFLAEFAEKIKALLA